MANTYSTLEYCRWLLIGNTEYITKYYQYVSIAIYIYWQQTVAKEKSLRNFNEEKWLPSEHAYIYTLKNLITFTDFVTLFFFYFLDLENWNGTDRHHFNAIVSDQDFVEVYIQNNTHSPT